jgi:hypothetical protein
MGQKRNFYLPTVARTKDEVVNRNLDSIFDTFRRLSQIIGDILAGNQAQDMDRKVASGTTDATPGVLIDKVESDGTLTISENTTTKKVDFVARAGSTSQTGILQLSTAIPTLDDGTGTAGAEGKAADGAHQHPDGPTVALTKRYYLTSTSSDILRDGYNGYLLSLTNPFDEAHAVDLDPPGSSQILNWFDSPVGEPGLTVWPSGIVKAHIRVRVKNTHAGLTYNLYPGDASIAYERVLYTTAGTNYQVAPYPAGQVVTDTYSTVEMGIYVMQLTGSAAVRLRADLILQATGSGYITDEVLELRIGGDNASYFDTLFTPSSGGPTVHNDLTGRGYGPDNATDCHPMASITAGWLQTPTSQRAVVGGLLALASSSPPVTSNVVTVVGVGPLVGIETTGKNNGDELTLFFLSAMTVTNNGTTGDAAYAPIAFGTMGLGTPLQDVAMTQYSCLKIGWHDGVWRPVAPWFICEAT